MPILSLEQPLTYIFVILLLGVVYTLYKVATRKTIDESELATPLPLQDPIGLQKPMDLQKPVRLQRPEKYFSDKHGNTREIRKVLKRFENGSYLVLDAVGNPVRKKPRYVVI
ncbi:MAG: hypothetical protein AB1333_04780 [Patescibacteria group bacterium]